MKRKDYERPRMRVVDIQQHMAMLMTSRTEAQGTPDYNGFNNEEEW